MEQGDQFSLPAFGLRDQKRGGFPGLLRFIWPLLGRLQADIRIPRTPFRVRNKNGSDPGWSSRALLDPGLSSGIPSGWGIDTRNVGGFRRGRLERTDS
jgi:hypothetical protein